MTQNLKIQKVNRLKLVSFLALLGLLGLALFYVQNLLVSLVLAFVGFYLISPLVDYLERKGLGRSWSTLILFVLFSTTIWILLKVFFPILVTQFESLKTELPKYKSGFDNILTDIKIQLRQFMDQKTSEQIIVTVQNYTQVITQNIFSDLPNHIGNSLTVLFLAPFLCFFMLLDGREWIRKYLSLVPNNLFELMLHLNYQISSQMGKFIRARLFETLFVGFTIWIGLAIMDFPYALFLALTAGLLNLIPYIGPVIGAAPAFIIAMINQKTGTDYAILSAIYLSAQIFDAVVIVPFVVAKIVNLHPVTVVLSVMVGSQVLGVLGMIISIPVASIIKVTFQSLYNHVTNFKR